MASKDGAARGPRRRSAQPSGGRVFAALDLGTNNCRLLLAEPSSNGFRVLDSFSRIIRLGEGLSASGVLGEAAMARAIDALRMCARTVAPHPQLTLRCIATQACRVAGNGQAFLDRVRQETGLAFEIVSPAEEARLSVLGCAALFDPKAEVALVIDIGGGSTELSWVDARSPRSEPAILAWTSLGVGVVTLAESLPEPEGDRADWYAAMCAVAADAARAFEPPDQLREVFARGAGHIVGTSGAVSSLAGVHLELPRYQRSKVDGLWMDAAQVRSTAARVRDMGRAARAAHPCIGKDRADLVSPGSAILEAVCDQWPAERVRVADRGLREGVLLELIAADRAGARA